MPADSRAEGVPRGVPTEVNMEVAAAPDVWAELCESHDDGQSGVACKTWLVSKWLESVGVASVVADALLADLRQSHSGRAPFVERAFARQLGARGSQSVLFGLLSSSSLLEQLADRIYRSARQLHADQLHADQLHAAPSGPPPSQRQPPLSAKFDADGGCSAAGFATGGLGALHAGLDALMPLPEMDEGDLATQLETHLESEHCDRADSRTPFVCSELGGMQTTSQTELVFVADPEHGAGRIGVRAWPQPRLATPSHAHGVPARRVPRPLRDLEGAWARVNSRLHEARALPLRRAELIACRLFTGPMRTKYNAVLRSAGARGTASAALLHTLCQGNEYTTTLHVLNGALRKLGKLTLPTTVYRPLAEAVLPIPLWRADRRGVCAAVEAGVLSVVGDAAAAMVHTSRLGGGGTHGLRCALLAIEMPMGCCAASLSWLSEFPEERELAWPPLTAFTLRSARVEAGTLLVCVTPSWPAAGEAALEAAERRALERQLRAPLHTSEAAPPAFTLGLDAGSGD